MFDEPKQIMTMGIRYNNTGDPHVHLSWPEEARKAAASVRPAVLHPLLHKAQARALQAHAPALPEPDVQA